MAHLNNKVFCIGLSRTGTTTLHHFFSDLGIKSAHYSTTLFANADVINKELSFPPIKKRKFIEKWVFEKEWGIEKSKRHEAVSLLSNHQVFEDYPIPILYKALDQKFSGSKFIYTYRSEQSWLKSMDWMLKVGKVIWNWREIDFELLHHAYGTHKYEPEKLIDAYRKHHVDVLSYFENRKNDLLIINLDDGGINFPKICEFLEIDQNQNIVKNFKANQSRKVTLKQKLLLPISKIRHAIKVVIR